MTEVQQPGPRAPSPSPQTAPGPGTTTGFFGRREQLLRLHAAADGARRGLPSLVVLDGLPGVGKTALVRRFTDEIPDFTVLAGRATQDVRETPYASVERMTARLPAPDRAGFPTPYGAGSGVPAPTVGAELLRLVDRLQRTAPVVLVLDNAQWADADSLGALAFTLQRLWRERVLTILVLPHWPPPWEDSTRQALEGAEQTSRIHLAGLSAAEVEAMAVAVRGEAVGRATAGPLHARTGGHPLYLSTLLAQRSGADEAGPRGGARMPPELAAAILRQVAGLPREHADVLDVLAVLDGTVPLPLLTSVHGREPCAAALEAAVGTGLIEWAAGDDGPPAVSFHHALQREAVYRAMSPARRRSLHLAAADVVDRPTALAHRVAAAQADDPRLAAELCDLAEQETAEGLLAQAATHLLWASRLLGPVPGEGGDPEAGRLLCGAIRLLFWAGMDAENLGLLEEAAALPPSPLRDEAMGLLEVAMGRLTSAQTLLGRARDSLWAQSGQTPEAVAVAAELAGVCLVLGAVEDAERIAGEAMELAGRGTAAGGATAQDGTPSGGGAFGRAWIPPGVLGSARAFHAYGRALQGDGTPGLDALDYLPPRPDSVADEDLPGLVCRGQLRVSAGRFADAEADLTAATARTRPGGARVLGLSSRIHLGTCRFLSGDWNRATRDAEIGLTMVESRGRRFDRAVLYSLISTVEAARGDHEDAERHIGDATEEARSLDYVGPYFHIALARAMGARARGDHHGVLDALSGVAGKSAFPERSRLFAAWWLPFLAESLIGCDRLPEARMAMAFLTPAAEKGGHLAAAYGWLTGRLAEAGATSGPHVRRTGRPARPGAAARTCRCTADCSNTTTGAA